MDVSIVEDATEWMMRRNAELDLLARLVKSDEVMEVGDPADPQLITRVRDDLAPETPASIHACIAALPETSHIIVPELKRAQQQGHVLTFRIRTQVFFDLTDVFELEANEFFVGGEGRRERARKAGYDTHLLVCSWRGEFRGSVWLFTHRNAPNYLGFYAIRASVLNIVIPGAADRRGVARALITGATTFAQQRNLSHIVVPWPLVSMMPILIKHGFHETNTCRTTPERHFFSGLTGTSNYFTRDVPTTTTISRWWWSFAPSIKTSTYYLLSTSGAFLLGTLVYLRVRSGAR
jgi:hypothetical protein